MWISPWPTEAWKVQESRLHCSSHSRRERHRLRFKGLRSALRRGLTRRAVSFAVCGFARLRAEHDHPITKRGGGAYILVWKGLILFSTGRECYLEATCSAGPWHPTRQRRSDAFVSSTPRATRTHGFTSDFFSDGEAVVFQEQGVRHAPPVVDVDTGSSNRCVAGCFSRCKSNERHRLRSPGVTTCPISGRDPCSRHRGSLVFPTRHTPHAGRHSVTSAPPDCSRRRSYLFLRS